MTRTIRFGGMGCAPPPLPYLRNRFSLSAPTPIVRHPKGDRQDEGRSSARLADAIGKTRMSLG
jgi:hypothetical protein